MRLIIGLWLVTFPKSTPNSIIKVSPLPPFIDNSFHTLSPFYDIFQRIINWHLFLSVLIIPVHYFYESGDLHTASPMTEIHSSRGAVLIQHLGSRIFTSDRA